MLVNFNKKIFTKKYHNSIEKIFNDAINILKPKSKDLEVSVSFLSKSEIKKLNREFRGVDKETDVLSFPTLLEPEKEGMQLIKSLSKEDFSNDINHETGNIVLGDICICLNVCFKQAKAIGNTKSQEVVYLAVHGLLHLFGYDHMEEEDKKEMRKIENKILNYKR